MKLAEVMAARKRAAEMFAQANIVLTQDELENIEVADFGLDELERTGLQLVTYINTDRYCAKELVLFPGQTCPEHRHPDRSGQRGKEETFRCRAGRVYLNVAGPATENRVSKPPEGDEEYYTVFHEIVLNPGNSTPSARTPFTGSKPGQRAIVSEFSSSSDDESDIFTDPRIKRIPEIED